ncbi:class I SAM-dependent methyltransferase [Clostridium senegalense]
MGDKDREIKKGITDLFDRVSSVFDDNGPRFFKYFGEELVKFADIKYGEKVLDVASGKGASLFLSAKKVGESGEVIGIDISKGMVDETNLEIKHKGIENAQLIVMDAENLDFESEYFNHVLCGFGVFFFPNYEIAFKEIMRVLKSGGKVSFTTFLRKKDENFIWLDELVEEYLPEYEEDCGYEETVEFDTEEGLYKILKESNFKNIKIEKEEKIFIYKDEQEWWDKLYTHGYVTILDAIPLDKMEEFKLKVFENLKVLKKENGIENIMYVLYAKGEK